MFIINNEKWRIRTVHPFHKKLYRPDGRLTVAACDDNDKTIYLSKNLKGDFLKRVLLHELSHAVFYSYSVNIPTAEEEFIAELFSNYAEEVVYLTNKIIIEGLE
jgi:hypothetical protein